MAGNLVVVAIPGENDSVWKVSSEKVPHLTLLVLGEDADTVPNLEEIILFVEHAANTTLRRFYLPVDRRGELGDAKADVVFFKKDRYDFKAIRDFRATLLKDSNIKSAYDATSQFELPDYVGAPGQPWVPHLTLGYPDSPAKPIDSNGFVGGIYSVEFTKIAVWTGDFEGPEFQLKDYWDDFDIGDIPMDVAMSDLAHYGVKGMRWGVRNEKGGSNTSGVGEKKKPEWGSLFDPQGHNLGLDIFKAVVWPAVPPLTLFAIPSQVRLARGAARGAQAKAVDINEKRFANHAQSHKNFQNIHNAAGARINREIPKLNEKYKGDLTKDPKKQKAYDSDVQKMLQDSYREAAQSIGNKPNTMHLDLEFRNDGLDFAIKARQGAATPLTESVRVRHADDVTSDTVELNYTGKVLRDATGHFKGLKFDDPSQDPEIQQTIDLGEAFLAHYGVKGMRWGITRTNLQKRRIAQLRSEGDKLNSRADKAIGATRAHALRSSAKQKHKHADALENLVNNRETRQEARKSSPEAVDTTATSVVPRGSRRKTKIKTEGGENHPAHEDAIKVARAQTKLKKSGTAALSNKELQDLQTRLNLERNVNTLVRDTSRIGKGRKFVREATGFNQEVNTAATTGLNTVSVARRARRQFA